MTTRRQIFDKIKAHLLKQNARAMSGPDCRYRGAGGLSCAVGCIISDEHYKPRIEGRSVKKKDVLEAVRKSNKGLHIDNVTTRAMLQELQNIHDVVKVDHWPTRLDEMEREYFKPKRSK